MDFDPSPWAAWLGIATALSALIGAACGLLWRESFQRGLLKQRLDNQDADIAEIKSMLATNFGPNSGGLREAVNGISTRLDDHIRLHETRR